MAMGTRILLFMTTFNIILFIFSLTTALNPLSSFGITTTTTTSVDGINTVQTVGWNIANIDPLLIGILSIGGIITAIGTALVTRDSSFLVSIPITLVYIVMIGVPLSVLISLGINMGIVLLFTAIWIMMFLIAVFNFIRGGDF